MVTKILLLVLVIVFGNCAEYSQEIARQMALYSMIAYESEEDISSWSCLNYCEQAQGIDPQVFYNSDKNTFGFVAYNPKINAIVVAFRGSTSDIKDWITNLDSIRTQFPYCENCSVHQGFYKATSEVAELSWMMLQQLMNVYFYSQVIVTGHSLGGALATLFSIYALDLVGDLTVYTFGQPRVGNSNFAAYYLSRLPDTFRVVNYADIVVHSPPQWTGFEHTGVQVWYSPRGMSNYFICESEDKTCANSLSTLSFSTSDHFLDEYLAMKGVDQWSLMGSIFNLGSKIMWEAQVWGISEERIAEMEVEKIREVLGEGR